MDKVTLKQLRENANLTQKKAAESLKVNKNYISMLENGSRNPSDKMKYQLAQLYGCTISDIFLAAQTTKCDSKEET